MVKRVVRIQLPAKKLFEDLTVLAKNLFKSATYLVRQTFFKTGKILRYYSLWNIMKEKEEYLKLKTLAGAQTSQQLLLMINSAWKAYAATIKDWFINPNKYFTRPRIPGYQPKNGKFIVIWSSQQVRIKDGTVRVTERLMKLGFPAVPIDNLVITETNYAIVRLKPFYDKYMLELVYEKKIPTIKVIDEQKILGLDLGVNNLVATSDGLLIKGGIVKSINQFFNKRKAKIQAQISRQELKNSKRKQQLMRWRYNQLHDLLHKASRAIIRHCIMNHITTLVIGRNKNWKQNIRISRRNNQKFSSVPFHKLIQMIQYKAEEQGIKVFLISEEYTSQTCSSCASRSRSNRKHRGLFVCKKCFLVINADVNAARNIAKKAFPEFVRIGDSGCVAQPTKLIAL